MEEERLTLPPVSEASWDRYKLLRSQSLESMRGGVLPNIIVALNNYETLDVSLSSQGGGGYEDDDQADLADYHPQAIALVGPAIAGMIQHMTAVLTIARQVDAGFIAAGRAPLFGVPQEQPE